MAWAIGTRTCVAKPPSTRDTEMAIVFAQILLAAAAGGAGPTTDPGINGNRAADDRRIGVAVDAFDHAGDLMTECEGQGAPGADIELLVGAEGEVAILQVLVGMANATAFDAHQDLTAAR
jgi:hypothetical protein